MKKTRHIKLMERPLLIQPEAKVLQGFLSAAVRIQIKVSGLRKLPRSVSDPDRQLPRLIQISHLFNGLLQSRKLKTQADHQLLVAAECYPELLRRQPHSPVGAKLPILL